MKKIITDSYFYGNTGNRKHADFVVDCMPDVELHPTWCLDGEENSKKPPSVQKHVRFSKNAHVSVMNNPFIPMFETIVRNANNLIWNKPLRGVWETDTLNYIVYDEPGAHFDWHEDSYLDDPEPYCGRQLSISYSLSHASDYEGCEFCIGDEEFKMDYGDFIVFPSHHTMHRIKPMKSGIRKVLVAWFT